MSFPEPRVWGPRSGAPSRPGIPVITINSGSDAFRSLGVLAHVGQPEGRAGPPPESDSCARARAGSCASTSRSATSASTPAAPVWARAVRSAGGSARVLGIDDQSPDAPRVIAPRGRRRLGSTASSRPTPRAACCRSTRLAEARRAGRVEVAAFDLGPDTLRAVEAGKLLFAIDQQPYLQGYLPMIISPTAPATDYFPARGTYLATGANFVTRDNAAKALRLSERAIR